LPTRTSQIDCISFCHAEKNFGIATKSCVCAAKIFELRPKALHFAQKNKLTAFALQRSENLGVYQQKQLKLNLFCPAGQRNLF
jgi:hypothetical protein